MCQTRRHLPKAIFEKNVTRLDKFTRVMSKSREFGASGHCLICSQVVIIECFSYFVLCSWNCDRNCVDFDALADFDIVSAMFRHVKADLRCSEIIKKIVLKNEKLKCT